MNNEVIAYIVQKSGIIIRGHGKFVTLKNKKGEYTVFRDAIYGYETPSKYAKTRLWDFPDKFLAKTASHCREIMIEDADFRAWKSDGAIGRNEYNRIRKMTDDEILTEYFGVEK